MSLNTRKVNQSQDYVNREVVVHVIPQTSNPNDVSINARKSDTCTSGDGS